MGKIDQQLPLHQRQIDGASDSGICCEGCSMGLSRMCRVLNFRCIFVLILSVSVFLSAIFWVLPHHSRKSGFDAADEIKHSATVQAQFRLRKPVSLLVPRIPRLEYDINEEIGVPDTKVAILSMHPAWNSNWTNVMFGYISDPLNVPINIVSLSVLRSSLIELFLQRINLTLTTSTFGQPSSFEILKFPGGITVIPEQSVSIWQIPQIFFNFTLPNSIYEIKENFVELKEQLTLGLHLTPDENIYAQVTNGNGSTRDPPVTVQVSVLSDLGSIVPQRLKQLAQTITGSPAKNLGLNNTVFGRVKQISLSSYLNSTLHAPPPTPSPAPSPEQNDYAEPSYPPSPAISPSYAPAPLPRFRHLPPCFNCDTSSPSDGSYPASPSPANGPHHSLPPKSNAPAPSPIDTHSPCPSPHCGSEISPIPFSPSQSNPLSPTLSPHSLTPCPPPMAPTSQTAPGLSPLPVVAYSSSSGQDKEKGKSSAPPPTSSAYITAPSLKTWLFFIFTLLTFRHLR